MASAPAPVPRPLLVTMGDPAGVGPEIVVAAHARGALRDALVIGDPSVLRRAGAAMTAVVEAPSDLAEAPPGCLPVLPPPGLPEGLSALAWGRVDARAGAAAARCIEHAATLVLRGAGRALVTAPVHKEALAAAGVPYPGHTEMLQALAGAAAVRMMLASPELKVVLVTIHLSLRRAIEAVTRDAVLDTIRIAANAAAGWPRAHPGAPRIAVAGLNPHAGEGGLFGDEEQRLVAPAVAHLRAAGLDATGPLPADTLFLRASRGEFDGVVALYHDQGHIPIKLLGMHRAVNITLGLPLVRTSVAHGTGFDIVGTGAADPASMLAALEAAERLVTARSRFTDA